MSRKQHESEGLAAVAMIDVMAAETMAAMMALLTMVMVATQAAFHHAMMHSSASATTSPSALAPVVQASVYMKMTYNFTRFLYSLSPVGALIHYAHARHSWA